MSHDEVAAAYHAIIAGASGAVGSAVVRSLLASARCASVIALVRRPLPAFDSLGGGDKHRVSVIDFNDLERETAIAGAGCRVAFCTVGIGQPRKATAEEHHRVDVEYAGAFARGAAAAGLRHISLLSSVGANASSRNRYVRTKGLAEQAVIAAGIQRTSIFRPSLLVTDAIRYGLQDRITQAVFPLISPLLPARYHQVHVDDLGRAMVVNAERGGPAGVEYLYYDFQRRS
jgi:uncharacterized protein YbjT (DUF2867 family)